MSNKEINPIIGIAVAVIVVGITIFFGYRALQPPAPSGAGYEPGVPPWMRKSSGASQQAGAPHLNPNAAATPPPPPGANVPQPFPRR